ncbi:MAG: PIN domain-containing protein [Dorea sp.]
MKLLIDTNIVLDVLLKREPFCTDAIKVLNLAGRPDIEEYLSASAITDIFYVAYRMIRDKTVVRSLINQLLKIVSVASVSEKEIQMALELEWNDFEDSVQYSVALLSQMDGIVTRNLNDYKKSEIPVWLPDQIVEKLDAE